MMDDPWTTSVLAIPILLIVAMIYGVLRWRSRGPTRAEREEADHPRHVTIDKIQR